MDTIMPIVIKGKAGNALFCFFKTYRLANSPIIAPIKAITPNPIHSIATELMNIDGIINDC